MSTKTLFVTMSLFFIVGSTLASDPQFSAVQYNGKRLSSSEIHGLRYRALKAAVKKCQAKGFKECRFQKFSDNSNKGRIVKYEAVVSGVTPPGRPIEYRTITVNSGEMVSSLKLSSLALDGYRLSTLQTALETCQKEGWQICSIIGVSDQEINKRFFDQEWNENAYKSVVVARVRGSKY